jgi:hypothetical protein
MSLTMLKALLPLQHMPHSTFSLTILKSVWGGTSQSNTQSNKYSGPIYRLKVRAHFFLFFSFAQMKEFHCWEKTTKECTQFEGGSGDWTSSKIIISTCHFTDMGGAPFYSQKFASWQQNENLAILIKKDFGGECWIGELSVFFSV